MRSVQKTTLRRFAVIALGTMLATSGCVPDTTPPSGSTTTVPSSTTSTTSTTTSAPTTTAAPNNPTTWTTATVPLPNKGIAFDKQRNVLLVSVDRSVPLLGNHVVEMNPRTGAIARKLLLPGGPGVIAIAADGSRAYIALVSSPTVAEVNLSSFTVTRQFTVGVDSGPSNYYVEDLEIQPGNPSVVAVTRNEQNSTGIGGVAIFDQGVKRPRDTSALGPRVNRIAWGSTPETIYGFFNGSTSYDVSVLTVTSEGVAATKYPSVISGSKVDIEYSDGHLHATSGQVVDVSNMTRAGAYTTSGVIEVKAADATAFFLKGSILSGHNTTTLLQKWSRSVPDISARDLVDTGIGLAAAGSASILLVGPGVSAGGYVPPVAPPSIVQMAGAKTLALSTTEIVASPTGNKLYAVVPQSAAAHPGEVVRINPVSGVIEAGLFVGADPYRIAISEDGSRLMVGHCTANRLTEIRASDLSIAGTVQLDADEWADDIAPVPGAPRAFAVVRKSACGGSYEQGIVIIKDGIVLPTATSGSSDPTVITFAGDPTRLYGYNNASTEFGFSTLAVDATGVRILSTVKEVFYGFGHEIVASGGLVYSSNGAVVSPTMSLSLGAVTAGQPVPVPTSDRLITVSGSNIQEFDLDGFWTVKSTTFAGGTAVDATRVGNTLAIATKSGSIVLVPLGAA